MAATIKGNTISSNIEAIGISTVYVGTGAPAFDISNNTLLKAVYKLKANDVKS
ncbi:hypothetical protein D3C86_1480340 [compost metagenome]